MEKFTETKSKKVIDTKTGKIFNSVKELCFEINENHSFICRQLNGIRKNNTNYKYI